MDLRITTEYRCAVFLRLFFPVMAKILARISVVTVGLSLAVTVSDIDIPARR
jgi:hypothetical protein